MQKGIVRGVQDNEAASLVHILLKRLLHFSRPSDTSVLVTAVEVDEHRVVLGKLRLPVIPSLFRRLSWRRSGNRCGESACGRKNRFDRARARFPIVVIDAVNNEDRKTLLLKAEARNADQKHAQ